MGRESRVEGAREGGGPKKFGGGKKSREGGGKKGGVSSKASYVVPSPLSYPPMGKDMNPYSPPAYTNQKCECTAANVAMSDLRDVSYLANDVTVGRDLLWAQSHNRGIEIEQDQLQSEFVTTFSRMYTEKSTETGAKTTEMTIFVPILSDANEIERVEVYNYFDPVTHENTVKLFAHTTSPITIQEVKTFIIAPSLPEAANPEFHWLSKDCVVPHVPGRPEYQVAEACIQFYPSDASDQDIRQLATDTDLQQNPYRTLLPWTNDVQTVASPAMMTAVAAVAPKHKCYSKRGILGYDPHRACVLTLSHGARVDEVEQRPQVEYGGVEYDEWAVGFLVDTQAGFSLEGKVMQHLVYVDGSGFIHSTITLNTPVPHDHPEEHLTPTSRAIHTSFKVNHAVNDPDHEAEPDYTYTLTHQPLEAMKGRLAEEKDDTTGQYTNTLFVFNVLLPHSTRPITPKDFINTTDVTGHLLNAVFTKTCPVDPHFGHRKY